MANVDACPSVVVVDDEPSVVRLVCDVLDDAGISAKACAFGAGAYPCIRTQHPKLILLDIQMPVVDGIQVFRQLRADPATADIPVIFLTANAHVLYAQLPNFLAMGATVLPKPFNVATLVSRVRHHLS